MTTKKRETETPVLGTGAAGDPENPELVVPEDKLKAAVQQEVEQSNAATEAAMKGAEKTDVTAPGASGQADAQQGESEADQK